MVSRRLMLVVSFVCAIAVYSALFYLSPQIALLKANSAVRDAAAVFRVDLREVVTPAPAVRPLSAVDAPGRPSSVRDLLEDELERLMPEFEPPVTEMIHVAERITEDLLTREHDLERDESMLRKVDARILEISQEVARENIEVARRLVRPSTMRVLDRDELPTLRAEGGELLDTARAAQLPDWSALTAPELSAAEPVEDGFNRPEFEEGVLNPQVIEQQGLPELPVELIVAREPVRRQVQEESPYEFMDDLVGIELTTYVPPGGGEGYFRLRVAPREDRPIEVLPKDVTFVIDASRSIMQRKLDLTVRGVKECIGMLRPEDRFNIIVFRDTATYFRPDLMRATPEEKAAAAAFLDGLQARGGTDVYGGVGPVMETPPREGMAGLVMVLSDGRPTTGVMASRDVINALTDDNVHRNTIYAFGGGNTVDQYLLDLLAYRNKGEAHVAGDYTRMDRELTEFFRRLNDPVLVNLRTDFGRIAREELYPKEMPDFYKGRETQIYGKFDPSRDKDFVMRLQGQAGTGRKEVVFRADLTEADRGDVNIARSWAFQKVYYLIGEICRVGERPDLVAELERLSREYNIRTSYSP